MKNTISLNGTWQIEGVGEAHVPGEVHVDLLRSGQIPDPYYGTNADQAQWIEEKQWRYSRTFEVDPDFLQDRTYLELDGLDTYATIYLNGVEVGKAANMFIPHRFEVSDVVQEGENTVTVEFEPAAKRLEQMDHSGLYALFDQPRVNARKMQCAFGWDWTHRFVGAGIWRDARLVSYGTVSIADVHIMPAIEGGEANAWITIDVENHTFKQRQVLASIVVALGDDREKLEIAEWIPPDGGVIEAVIRIEQPQLWWPNGFGEQTLYTCMIGVQCEGEVEDVVERRFGLRDVRFAEQDVDGNPTFTLLINGEEVFCKGANWIPADHFVSNVTPERYRKLLTLAHDAHFNMLRVWGGGVYESPEFYGACDEMGIMVWQDFMFSCAHYPDTDEFAKMVEPEVRSVVKQLRGHPSIVVWCGNNECEMQLPPDAQWPGKKLFHELIPSILKELDPSRPYRASSPLGGSPANSPDQGDWHGGSWFKAYLGDHNRWRHMIEQERGLFVSEFTTQGPPLVESLREFIPEDKLFPPTNDVWEYHNKDNPHSNRTDGLTHQQILVDLTRRMMGEPETVEQFAAYGGTLQGEFLKAGIEHYRREKWAISGAMFWMYNDCWPGIDWSVVDYYLRPKTAYYYVKRAFAPVIVSFKQLEDRVQAYVTSDVRTIDLDGTLQVAAFTFGTRGLDVQSIPVKLPANSSMAVWESQPLDELLTQPERQCIVAYLRIGDDVIARNVYFPRVFREMDFPQPKLYIRRAQIDENSLVLSISSDDYARSVAVSNLPDGARISDNWFDLLPGETAEVSIDGIDEKQAAGLAVNVWRA